MHKPPHPDFLVRSWGLLEMIIIDGSDSFSFLGGKGWGDGVSLKIVGTLDPKQSDFPSPCHSPVLVLTSQLFRGMACCSHPLPHRLFLLLTGAQSKGTVLVGFLVSWSAFCLLD